MEIDLLEKRKTALSSDLQYKERQYNLNLPCDEEIVTGFDVELAENVFSFMKFREAIIRPLPHQRPLGRIHLAQRMAEISEVNRISKRVHHDCLILIFALSPSKSKIYRSQPPTRRARMFGPTVYIQIEASRPRRQVFGGPGITALSKPKYQMRNGVRRQIPGSSLRKAALETATHETSTA